MPTEISAPELAAVRALYEAGLYQQAYARSKEIGPLNEWRGPDARVLAGRLAHNLGAPRLGRMSHLRGWREDRNHHEAAYYHARALLDRHGALASWRFIARNEDLSGASERIRADWYAMRATIASILRDFDTAERLLARAEALAGDRAWIWVERSTVLEQQDKYDEALASARRSLELSPWHRPGVQAAAHLLHLLDRAEEAIELLQEATRRTEVGHIHAHLAGLLEERGRYEEARQSFERYVELSPLLEKDARQWVAGRRSDTAYHCGDVAAAIAHAKEAKNPFYDKIAAKLERPEAAGAKRVLLPVAFVRQHHSTCAPATLSAVSRFWSMPADHLTVAEAICYDGTPAHSERQWAEDNGWATREFTTDWDSTLGLIDRGIPFTLTTTQATRGHLQAVMGYDARRRTLLIRDPYFGGTAEAVAEQLFENQRSNGPRGMAMVPRAEAHKLADLNLPDAVLYDHGHTLQRALTAHDRAGAEAAFEAMRTFDPEHRLTLFARRSLAAYDADVTTLLATVEKLLEKFPDDAHLRLSKLSYLRTLGRRQERIDLLEAILAKKNPDPIFLLQYARELMDDAREHRRVARLLRRAIRINPMEAENLRALADVEWGADRREQALELYRFAACLNDKDENLAHTLFIGCRHMRRTADALQFLQARYDRFAAKSGYPARTLYWAHEDVGQDVEAFAVLDKALALRPQDGELMLFAADAHGRHGNFERAVALLADAEKRTPRSMWLRSSAELAQYRGELAEACALWRQIVDAEPLAVDGHRALTRLLAETSGRNAAIEYLRAAADRFPHNYPLHQLLIEWQRDDGPDAAEPLVRRLIDNHPVDAWARRELASCLGEMRRFDEALAAAAVAAELDPRSPALFNVRGSVHAGAGNVDAARADFHEAIRVAVDNDFAISHLLGLATSPAQKRDELAFVRGELRRQVVFGDGLLAYRAHAADVLQTDELLEQLREALDARPDLWHAWAAVARQLADMDRLDEARALLRDAVARFPLMPRLWLDLATVCRLLNDSQGEIDALLHARQISPTWGAAARQLSSVHERIGDWAAARAVLEQAVARAPLDALNHGCLADVLWKSGDRQAALARVEQALVLDPGYDWAWDVVRDWSRQLERPDLPAQLARALTQRRGGETRSWLVLAKTLDDAASLDERLAAIDRAIKLNPRLAEAHATKARLLAEAGRYDEALAAARPSVFGDDQPAELRARVAWIDAQRGNLRGAIATMRQLVNDVPGYYPGWRQLAEWYEAEGADAKYVETAEEMTRRWPHDATSWTLLGEAQLKRRRTMDAITSYTRAVQLAPEQTYAAFKLFDLHYEADELDPAAGVLDVLRRHAPGDHTTARAVQLAVRRSDHDAVRQGLAALFTSPTAFGWPIEAAVHAVAAAGWRPLLEKAFEEAVGLETLNPDFGAVWIKHLAGEARWKECLALLKRLERYEEAHRRAVVAYLEAAARGGQPKRVRTFIKQNREMLRADTGTWGHVGYTLLNLPDLAGVCRWMSDWPQRADAESWMLVNLVLALRHRNRMAEARAVSEQALRLNPEDGTPWHALWLAADAAADGRTAEARARVAPLQPGALDVDYRFLYDLVHTTCGVTEADPAGRRGRFPEVRRELEQSLARCPAARSKGPFRAAFHRCLWRIARDTGTFAAYFNAYRHSDAVPAVLVIFFILVGIAIGVLRHRS